MKLDGKGNPTHLSVFLSQSQLDFAEPRIVLVAEDEDLVRQMLARILSTAGYRTLEARNGTEALRMATFAYPYLHLVITDVVMPELDGRALGQRLRERFPALPVLYISGYAADDLFHRGAPSTSAPYLQKPIIPEELLRLVQQLLTGVPEQTLQT